MVVDSRPRKSPNHVPVVVRMGQAVAQLAIARPLVKIGNAVQTAVVAIVEHVEATESVIRADDVFVCTPGAILLVARRVRLASMMAVVLSQGVNLRLVVH
jgi:hypothetical protein